MLVDSHCHLDYLEADDDLDAVVARARAAGVAVLQTICTRLGEFERVRRIARRYDGVYCSLGVHPHNVAEESAAPGRARLVELAAHPEVIGIGETGLDYHYEHGPRALQRESFRVHIRAARAAGLPVIVHARDADADVALILREEAEEGAFSGVLHCFSAGAELARAALELGLYVSLSGIVTFKNAESLRRIVRELPGERLLVETDAPYLAPVPRRGARNEPAFVVHTAACVAELLGLDEAAFAALTSRNFFRLFARAKPPQGVELE